MCMLCVEWEKQKMTGKEAFRAIGEMLIGADKEKTKHLMALSDKVLQKEVPMSETNPELDKNWTDNYYEDN